MDQTIWIQRENRYCAAALGGDGAGIMSGPGTYAR